MKKEIYDIQVKDRDGWWTFDSAEGLDEAKERAKSEREEYGGEIRIKRRGKPPQIGQLVWYRPRQPDAFQGFSYPMEVVGEVIQSGVTKDLETFIRVRCRNPALMEETISMRDFCAKGVREYLGPKQ